MIKGTEQNRKATCAVALGTVGGVVMGFLITLLFTRTTPYSSGESGARFDIELPIQKDATNSNAFDPRLRSDWLRLSESTLYRGTGRNIFKMGSSPSVISSQPQPEPSSRAVSNQPSVPRVRLRFFGFASTLDKSKRIFLSKDGDVFIGREGEIIDRRYRIIQITPTSVEVEDLIDDGVQKLVLGEG